MLAEKERRVASRALVRLLLVKLYLAAVAALYKDAEAGTKSAGDKTYRDAADAMG